MVYYQDVVMLVVARVEEKTLQVMQNSHNILCTYHFVWVVQRRY